MIRLQARRLGAHQKIIADRKASTAASSLLRPTDYDGIVIPPAGQFGAPWPFSRGDVTQSHACLVSQPLLPLFPNLWRNLEPGQGHQTLGGETEVAYHKLVVVKPPQEEETNKTRLGPDNEEGAQMQMNLLFPHLQVRIRTYSTRRQYLRTSLQFEIFPSSSLRPPRYQNRQYIL
jgi:hypothetical protein